MRTALLLLVIPTAAVAAPAERPAPHRLWYSVMVMGPNFAGSGTPIYTDGKKTVILTNAHVASQDRTRMHVLVPGQGIYPAKRLAGYNVLPNGTGGIRIDGPDIALVEVDGDFGAVAIAGGDPSIGATIGHSGYGGTQPFQGLLPVAKNGRVVVSDNPDEFGSTMIGVSGDSGAGVFNTNGQLCGVSAGYSDNGPSHFAVRVSRVHRLLGTTAVTSRFPGLAAFVAEQKTAHPANPPREFTPVWPY